MSIKQQCNGGYSMLEKLRVFIKVRYKSDFIVLVRICRPFRSRFALIWSHVNQSWSSLTFGSTGEGKQYLSLKKDTKLVSSILLSSNIKKIYETFLNHDIDKIWETAIVIFHTNEVIFCNFYKLKFYFWRIWLIIIQSLQAI